MERHSQRTALVTGAAGFIGSHLVDLLLAQGHRVVALDNLQGGRKENLAAAWTHSHFHFHQMDIRHGESLVSLFQGVNWVFHLAALADIVPSIDKPQEYFEVNVTGTLRVLEAARAASVERLIYAASSSCYGKPLLYPTPESAPLSPEYPYALTKSLGEALVLHWQKVYRLPALSLRLFNVYGPRARTNGAYGAVFGVFLAQKYHGKPFTIVGDGTQTRDFTFITDVVRAFLKAAESTLSGEIFNVGSGATQSINSLVDLLGGERTFIPKRPGEPDCTFGDVQKIEKALQWKAEISFEEGVQQMVQNLEEYRFAPVWQPETIAEATRSWFEALCLKNV